MREVKGNNREQDEEREFKMAQPCRTKISKCNSTREAVKNYHGQGSKRSLSIK